MTSKQCDTLPIHDGYDRKKNPYAAPVHNYQEAAFALGTERRGKLVTAGTL